MDSAAAERIRSARGTSVSFPCILDLFSLCLHRIFVVLTSRSRMDLPSVQAMPRGAMSRVNLLPSGAQPPAVGAVAVAAARVASPAAGRSERGLAVPEYSGGVWEVQGLRGSSPGMLVKGGYFIEKLGGFVLGLL